MRVLLTTMAAVLTLVAIGRADRNLQQVAADAKWVVHVDVDALRASKVVQNAYHKCMEMHKDAAEHMDKITGIIGMDPRKDLHGITIYAKDFDKCNGVLILHAEVNQTLLKAAVAVAPEHKVTKHGDIEVHTWAAKGPHGSHPAAGAFFKPNVLVFGGSADAVAAALDVLAGKSSGVSGTSLLAGRTAPVRSSSSAPRRSIPRSSARSCRKPIRSASPWASTTASRSTAPG